MKITLNKTVQEDVEITLPFYIKKAGIYWYKVISEDKSIQVLNSKSSGKTISIVSPEVAFFQDWEKSTEEEFILAFDETKLILQNLAYGE